MFKTGVLSRDQFRSLQNLGPGYDFWKEPHIGGFALIMSPPEHRQRLFIKLKKSDIEFEVAIQDVKE